MSDKTDPAVMPEVTFSTFVLSLASSALVHLGEVPNPETAPIIQEIPPRKASSYGTCSTNCA